MNIATAISVFVVAVVVVVVVVADIVVGYISSFAESEKTPAYPNTACLMLV